MSFANSLSRRYKVIAGTKGAIDTHEPIKITYEIQDGIMTLQVDGYDYAVIEDVHSAADLDLEKVESWIRETYYDDGYKSAAYVPARIKKKDFANAYDIEVKE